MIKSIKEYEQILWNKYQNYQDPEIEERYEHSLSVGKKAMELIERFSLPVDKTKAQIAGILHDYAKFESMDKFYKIVEEYQLDKNLLNNSFKILHATLGPWIIKKEVGLEDVEILSAIKNHTTGNLNMSYFDEVLYLADFIDDTREGEYFESAKEAALTDFHKAISIKISRQLERNPNDEFNLEMFKKYAEVPWKA